MSKMTSLIKAKTEKKTMMSKLLFIIVVAVFRFGRSDENTSGGCEI